MPAPVDPFAAFRPENTWWVSILMVSLRVGAVFMMTPILAGSGLPARVRVLLVLGLSAALSMGLPGAQVTGPVSQWTEHPGALLQACFLELSLGITLATGILMAFGAFDTAGRLLDIQIGFGMGQVLDPASQARAPIITTAFKQLALLVFFLVNGHHALIRGLAYSLERFPLGQPWPIEGAVLPVLKQAAGIFSLSFVLAAPVVFAILMVEFGLGVLARNLPQINMLTLGIQVKLVAGLVALTLWFSAVGPVMNRVYGTIYRTWDDVFRAESVSPSSVTGGR